jgi:exopolyphosphatase/guanosine-5'-triphosphate,3'-diphosphate pyrophosphatase
MREVTVAQMIRRHGLDERHGLAVAELATVLYRDNAHGPSDEVGRSARLVGWAAQLREIGLSIAHTDFHKHGAYILANCDMPGFSIDEQARLATLVLGQTGGLTKMRSRLEAPDDWLRVLCLRLAVILHRRRDGVLPPWIRLRTKNAGTRLELPSDWTHAHPLTDQTLRQEATEWAKAGAWPLLYQLV